MAGDKVPMVETRNVNTGRPGPRIPQEMYDAVKAAILAVVPEEAPGFPWKELPAAVKRHAPPRLFERASVDWYTVTVKLDLEARGLIARVPGARPQRLVRTRQPRRGRRRPL